jgi:hypothetical protein
MRILSVFDNVNGIKKNSISTTKLVICCSPFQAYLWLLISEQKSIQNAKVLYITSHDTIKDKYYLEKLRQSSEFVEYFVIKGRLWKSLPELSRRLHTLQLKNKKIELYLASFNTFFSMYLFNILNIFSVSIFDDGIFSIISKYDRSPFRFNIKNLSILKRIQYKFLLKELDDQVLLNTASKFYTLFPSNQTLLQNCLIEPILMDIPRKRNYIDNINNTFEVRIFIGDVSSELTPKMFIDYVELLKFLPLDYYIQHPRDSKFIERSKKVIFIEEVAEEFIYKYLNLGYKVIVYSFSSSVLFTLGTNLKLQKIIIKHEESIMPSLYELASSNGIEVIEYKKLINICNYKTFFS